MKPQHLRIIGTASLVVSVLCARADGAAQPSDPGVVVSIGDFAVYEADLDAWWQTHEPVSYATVRQQWYDGRRKALDAILGDYLVQREATTRGTTVDNLLGEELPKRTAPVTDADIRQMYERSLPLPGGITFDQVKPTVAGYLQQQHVADARARFVSELRDAAHATIRLDPPRQPGLNAGGDPSTGDAAAPIQLVEFSDFECPFCRQLEPVLGQLRAKYQGRLRLVWKDFPLPIHGQARGAAEAARCAADQARFWEFHDALFANQQALGPDDLTRHATTTGLDIDRFRTCVNGGAHRSEITADLEEGARQGVEATPTVFVNGRAVIGAQPIDVYEKVIDEELSR